jgi:16S rRNA (cytosine1402-N4)-methyltransferase
MPNPEVYHIPALLPEVMDALQVRPDGIYADATFGGGGHSRAIFNGLGADGHLYSFDQDEEAVANAWTDPRFTIIHGNFRFIHQYLRFYSATGLDGILADLGVSFHHFDDPERGFSFRFSGPLDMRMNRRARRSAAELIAEESEEELARIFHLYGELRQSRRLAAAIVRARTQKPITTIEQLLEVCKPLISPKSEKKELAQLFQALRIVVNDEIHALEQFLTQALQSLRPGGRLAIITYHSLEDRLVKNFMRTGTLTGKENKDFYGRNLSPLRLLNSKPIVASDAEVERNPRSRSAKLRVAERVEITANS